MMKAGLMRRLGLLEAARQVQDAPPPQGLSALLTWLREHPPSEDYVRDPTRPRSGLERLLEEARDFMKKGPEHG